MNTFRTEIIQTKEASRAILSSVFILFVKSRCCPAWIHCKASEFW
jgi:hypothetical protein